MTYIWNSYWLFYTTRQRLVYAKLVNSKFYFNNLACKGHVTCLLIVICSWDSYATTFLKISSLYKKSAANTSLMPLACSNFLIILLYWLFFFKGLTHFLPWNTCLNIFSGILDGLWELLKILRFRIILNLQWNTRQLHYLSFLIIIF